MSQAYTSRKIYSNEGESEILVMSKNCQYKVWIGDEEITILGPGVSETSSLENFQGIDGEDLAILVIILFENGQWPED